MKYKVTIIRKKMKNIRLRVKADGSVIVSAPHYVKEAHIADFIDQKREWITQRLEKIKPLEYVTGESHRLFGKPYILEIIEHNVKRSRVERLDNRLVMHVPPNALNKKREQVLHRFYAKMLKQIVSEMIEDYCLIMKVSVNEVKYQHMTSRWGSCHIQKKVIKLNTKLAQYPVEVIESVVVHELVHLLEPSHNARFYQLMDQYYPDWQACDTILKNK